VPGDSALAPSLVYLQKKDFRAAWLLLLLRDGAGYGYVLQRRLGERGFSTERGAMYRTLRQLDGEGLISSRWMDPSHGPRRRLYELTPDGHAALGRIAATIESTRDAQTAFLTAYQN